MNYYAVVFLLRPQELLRRRPFFERKNVCNSQESGVRTRCAAIVNHYSDLLFLGVLIFKEIPWCFECFQLFFSGCFKVFLGFGGVKKSLVFWVVFLGFYLSTKEKKIRVCGSKFTTA